MLRQGCEIQTAHQGAIGRVCFTFTSSSAAISRWSGDNNILRIATWLDELRTKHA